MCTDTYKVIILCRIAVSKIWKKYTVEKITPFVWGKHMRRIPYTNITSQYIMGYKFRLQETVAENVQRVAIEQIDKALRYATTGQPDVETCVHEIRKCLKKLRALVRLVRPQLARCYARENTEFRTIAQLLSTTRDSNVMVGTFQKLKKRYSKAIPKNESETVEHLLQQQIVINDSIFYQRLADAILRLENARYRVAQWPLYHEGFTAIAPGAKAVYKSGKDMFATVRNTPTAEGIHNLRKQLKYHWYHNRLLTPLWPTLFDEYCSLLSTLTDVLGEHNDLAVFCTALLAHAEQEDAQENVLVGLAIQRQQELWAFAEPVCMRVYAESPSGFIQRLHSYWDAWMWKNL